MNYELSSWLHQFNGFLSCFYDIYAARAVGYRDSQRLTVAGLALLKEHAPRTVEADGSSFWQVAVGHGVAVAAHLNAAFAGQQVDARGHVLVGIAQHVLQLVVDGSPALRADDEQAVLERCLGLVAQQIVNFLAVLLPHHELWCGGLCPCGKRWADKQQGCQEVFQLFHECAVVLLFHRVIVVVRLLQFGGVAQCHLSLSLGDAGRDVVDGVVHDFTILKSCLVEILYERHALGREFVGARASVGDDVAVVGLAADDGELTVYLVADGSVQQVPKAEDVALLAPDVVEVVDELLLGLLHERVGCVDGELARALVALHRAHDVVANLDVARRVDADEVVLLEELLHLILEAGPFVQ